MHGSSTVCCKAAAALLRARPPPKQARQQPQGRARDSRVRSRPPPRRQSRSHAQNGRPRLPHRTSCGRRTAGVLRALPLGSMTTWGRSERCASRGAIPPAQVSRGADRETGMLARGIPLRAGALPPAVAERRLGRVDGSPSPRGRQLQVRVTVLPEARPFRVLIARRTAATDSHRSCALSGRMVQGLPGHGLGATVHRRLVRRGDRDARPPRRVDSTARVKPSMRRGRLFEHLDSEHITRRTGDSRVLQKRT